MKDDQKNKNTETEKNDNIENNEAKEGASPTGPKRGSRAIGVAIACATLFVILYAFVNANSISSVISRFVSVLAPIILGFAIAYILNPILKLFEFRVFKKMRSKRIRRAISLVITYVLAISFVVAMIMLILPELISSVSDFAYNFGYYIDTTIKEINTLISDYFGSHPLPEDIKKEDIYSFVSKFFNQSGDALETIGNYVIEYGKGLVIGVKNLILALFISVYVLVAKQRLAAQTSKIATAMLSTEGKDKLFKYVRICDKTFGGFFVGKIIDSLIIGIITLVTLMIFNIPYDILVSVIVCVTNVIPVFGPFIGAIPSFFIIFIVDPMKAFLFLIIILVIQQLDGNVIGPKILGNSTGMSSLGVMVAIIIMGDFFGVIGMILGVPIFAVALTLINEIVEGRLKKKNLPLNSAEYYPENSLVDPYEPHETLSHRFYSGVGHLFMKLWKIIFGSKRKNSGDASEDNGKDENESNEH